DHREVGKEREGEELDIVHFDVKSTAGGAAHLKPLKPLTIHTRVPVPTPPSRLTSPVRTRWNSNHPIERFFVKTVAAFALATAGLAQAGTFQTDFSSDPGGTGNVNQPTIMTLLTNSQLTLIDLKDILDENGVFQPSRLPLQASYVFPEIDPGSRVESFTATFKLRRGG